MFVDGAEEKLPLLDVQINEKTIEQFLSIQRLEEHYCPSSLSFGNIFFFDAFYLSAASDNSP